MVDNEAPAMNSSLEVDPDNTLEARSSDSPLFKFNSVGEMFKGYDLLKGDPTAPLVDPGFRNSIFKATYKNKEKTHDRNYMKPDHTDVMRKTACQESASSEETNSMTDYQKSMKVNAQFDISGGGAIYQAAFSASMGYSSAETSIVNEKKSIIKTEMTCLVYRGSVKKNPHPDFDLNFLNQLNDLGDNPSNLKYKQFIGNFGSHMIKEIFLGASYGKVQTLTKKDKEDMKKTGLDVSASASFSMASSLSISASVKYEQSKTDKTKFSNSVTKTSSYTRGALFPKGGINAWQVAAINNPSPVKISLRSILEIFDFGYFQTLEPHEKDKFKKIKEGLSEYIKNEYCAMALGKDKQRCAGPSPGCDGGNKCSVFAKCTDINPVQSAGNNGQCTSETASGYNCECLGDPDETDFTPAPNRGYFCKPPVVLADKVLQVSEFHQGEWGKWDKDFRRCKGLAVGIQFKHQRHVGGGTSRDDVGGTGLCLICDNDDFKCINDYDDGDWSKEMKCRKGSFLSGWRQNVQPYGRRADDTSLDNVEYTCKSADSPWEVTGTLNPVKHTDSGLYSLHGTWSKVARCPRNQFLCAVRGKVEAKKKRGDDSALDDLQHKCCIIKNVPE